MIAPKCGHETYRVIRETCAKCWGAEYRAKNREKIREQNRRADAKRQQGISNKDMWRYGITRKFYEELYHQQRGLCAICLEPDPRRLCVDHDHETQEVRGLLCRKCNTGIGQLRDSYEIVMKAAKYLKPKEMAACL